MPPFYIGSSSNTENITERGYRGSVDSKLYKNVWKQELREHPELFKTIIISTHENFPSAVAREEELQRKLDVANNPLYVNMSIANYKFGLSGNTHHMVCNTEIREKVRLQVKGRKWTEESRKRQSDNKKGKTHVPHSEETKRKLSEKKLGALNPRYGKPGPRLGVKVTKETRQKQRESAILRCKNKPLVIETKTCPHCGKIGTGLSMIRWHFDNCSRSISF